MKYYLKVGLNNKSFIKKEKSYIKIVVIYYINLNNYFN